MYVLNNLSITNNQVYESKDGVFQGIEITGTGYGHGIGMSQNGAKAFANKGYTYQQIIEHHHLSFDLLIQIHSLNLLKKHMHS